MKPVPHHAFTNVSGFEAKKHNMRQTNDGMWQLTLTVAEFGAADWLIHAQPGTPLAIGLKALDYDNPELVQSEDNPLKKYVARAGMLCKDESFQSFLGAQNVEQAAMAMKAELQIESRAELSDPYKKEARQRLDNLVDRFKEWKKSNDRF